VVRTEQMVKLDWQREVQVLGATACLRSYLTKSLGSTERLASFAKLSIPQVAAYTAGFRIGLGTRANGKSASYVIEALLSARDGQRSPSPRSHPRQRRRAYRRRHEPLANSLCR